MSAPFSRIYVDVPAELHQALKVRAVEAGKPMKVLLAELIEKECSAGSGSKRKAKRKE